MEWLFGVRYLPGRVLMIVLHLAVSYSLISLARGLAVRLAGVGAVVLIVGHPATLTYFTTGSRRCRPSISATISSPASPITTKVKDNGGDFIFTTKESSHPALYDFIKGAEAFRHDEKVRKGKTTHTLLPWFEAVPLCDGKDAMLVNWIGFEIIDAKDRVKLSMA